MAEGDRRGRLRAVRRQVLRAGQEAEDRDVLFDIAAVRRVHDAGHEHSDE
jgi:hypothetical protein